MLMVLTRKLEYSISRTTWVQAEVSMITCLRLGIIPIGYQCVLHFAVSS